MKMRPFENAPSHSVARPEKETFETKMSPNFMLLGGSEFHKRAQDKVSRPSAEKTERED